MRAEHRQRVANVYVNEEFKGAIEIASRSAFSGKLELPLAYRIFSCEHWYAIDDIPWWAAKAFESLPDPRTVTTDFKMIMISLQDSE